MPDQKPLLLEGQPYNIVFVGMYMLRPDPQLPARFEAGRPALKRVDQIRDGKKLAASFEAGWPVLKRAPRLA